VTGETTKTITVNVAGDRAVEPDEGFTVTLSGASGATLGTATARGTIVNDDGTTLSIAATNAVKAEGNSGTTPFTFTVTRAGSTSGTASAKWAVTGSGANPANAADFGGTLPSGTVTVAAGETTQTITINVAGDTLAEPDEVFRVTLSGATGATLGTATAKGTITNDDGSLAFAATDAVKAEDDTGTTPFTVTRTAKADLLLGGNGNDPLSGLAGADRLNGGDGADLFVLTALADSTPAISGCDRIMDFLVADGDLIDLSAIDANTLLADDQAFALIGEIFSGTPGALRIVSPPTTHIIEAAVNGGGLADLALLLNGTGALPEACFLP
jgi:Ca2+-binding RTX toxin-like protein